jgi:hypothetical protein
VQSADPADRPAAQDHEFPLRQAAIVVRNGAAALMRFHGRWHGAAGAVDPLSTGGTLRVAGKTASEGDSGTIRLPVERWVRKKNGFRYVDPTGASGGILALQFGLNRGGGVLKIKAGSDAWQYRLATKQTGLAVTLELGAARWCATFVAGDLKQRGQRRLRARASTTPGGCACDALVASTWAAIESIFAQHGCTQAVCHGAAPGQGRLDLRHEVAHEQLVGVASSIRPDMLRVLPGDKDASLLWQKLAARTLAWGDVPGTGMPVGDVAPLSEDELHIIELWIYNGAPKAGIVPRSERLLLSSCTPPPDPQKTPPPESPPPGEGVQLHSAPWSIPVEGEDEVCFPTYYDFSEQIPTAFRGPCPAARGGATRECFYYNRAELIQDPNSHHSIPRAYVGSAAPSDPAFGAWTCHGGPQAGTACTPTGIGTGAPLGADCEGSGVCAGKVVSSTACLGYGPRDFGQGFNLAESAGAPDIFVVTQPHYVLELPLGVMDAIPVKGVIVWNSHAFNATSKPTTNEQWLRLFFAPPEGRQYQLQDFFHIRDIFIQNVPPFTRRQYCTTMTFRPGTRLFEMVSHTHKRGALFEAWGPGVSGICSTAVDPACSPEPGPPVLRTTDYADPDRALFDPPLALDGDELSRSVKYCAVYDNGFTDPTDVKRRSTAPEGAVTCSDVEIACLDGPHRGELCGGDNAQCDSGPRAGDGRCDACPLRGWVTADDEMFAMLGSYYCATGVACVLPPQFPRQLPGGIPLL